MKYILITALVLMNIKSFGQIFEERSQSASTFNTLMSIITDERKIKKTNNNFITLDKDGKELSNRYVITTNSNNTVGLLYDTIVHQYYVVKDIANLKDGATYDMKRMNPLSGILYEKEDNKSIHFYNKGVQMSSSNFGSRRLDGTNHLIITKDGKDRYIIRNFLDAKTNEFIELDIYIP